MNEFSKDVAVQLQKESETVLWYNKISKSGKKKVYHLPAGDVGSVVESAGQEYIVTNRGWRKK